MLEIEIEGDYCCLAEKRLKLAEKEPDIQGYEDGVFWERNTLHLQQKRAKKSKKKSNAQHQTLQRQLSWDTPLED